ncbi:MAG: hypothetical protein WD795_06665 [Woeseia sp.]
MFKAIRISLLLLVLVFVSVSTWLTQSRSTDWNNSLWVKIYPINGDGDDEVERYIASLQLEDFESIQSFVAREIRKYGHSLERPVRMELGRLVAEQPPPLAESPGLPRIMLWSLKMRWWARRVAKDQDDPPPDVRIFVRYYAPRDGYMLENSVGMQKGMVGIVNAFADRRHTPINNVVIAHEFLHTLGATDKYERANGQPLFPQGYAEPERSPLLPQRYAEIMGGRIAVSEVDAMIPMSLRYVVIGAETAREIRLVE